MEGVNYLMKQSSQRDFLDKNTEVVCHFLLQGIFPMQRSNLVLLHCRQILYHLSHQGSPREKTTVQKLITAKGSLGWRNIGLEGTLILNQ